MYTWVVFIKSEKPQLTIRKLNKSKKYVKIMILQF